MTSYPVIQFHQFGGEGEDDLLMVFAAPAAEIYNWAGIPRKGWRLRMLYQRWITPGREGELRSFWQQAAQYEEDGHPKRLLGPTALTLAATQPPVISEDGRISLIYEPPYSVEDDDYARLGVLAVSAVGKVRERLTEDELVTLDQAAGDLTFEFEDYEPNHVLESAIQIAQIGTDPEAFVAHYEIADAERRELVQALEAFTKPALVVDGQHRLFGAADAGNVSLPAVLLPHASWIDQIYQFVTINETAKKVDTGLLTDIFGNSLTPSEQDIVRRRFKTSKIDVEARIAAVIAAQRPDSPFRGLVRVAVENLPDDETPGYLTEATIRQLIDGGRGVSGWRSDSRFYDEVVAARFPDRESWEAWSTGQWTDYWFAFWRAVRDFYNAETTQPLWTADGQTNLTKAVTLRLMQRLYMEKAIERADAAKNVADILRPRLSPQDFQEAMREETAKVTLPETPEKFEEQVREHFLAKGVPVRVFTRPWVKSLDDASGIEDLWNELQSAYDICSRDGRYHAHNTKVFSVASDDDVQ